MTVQSHEDGACQPTHCSDNSPAPDRIDLRHLSCGHGYSRTRDCHDNHMTDLYLSSWSFHSTNIRPTLRTCRVGPESSQVISARGTRCWPHPSFLAAPHVPQIGRDQEPDERGDRPQRTPGHTQPAKEQPQQCNRAEPCNRKETATNMCDNAPAP